MMSAASRNDDTAGHAVRFIEDNLALQTVPGGLAPMRLYRARPDSGLGRLGAAVPYWAYWWAGGLALAHFIAEHPQTVADRSVVDIGSGSGLVAIAAARAGAAVVDAAELDAFGRAAIALNAAANAVSIRIVDIDVAGEALPDASMILAGDVFYSPEVAARMIGFFTRCTLAGRQVLVGDPFRTHLPVDRLEQIAEYRVPDMGDPPGLPGRTSGVFRFLG